MGGRGTSSGAATAKNSAVARLRQIADRYKDNPNNVYRVTVMKKAADAAVGLAEDATRTTRLIESPELTQVVFRLRDQDVRISPNSSSVLGAIERWLEPGLGNRPLGMTEATWASIKERGGDAVRALQSQGYSTEEIAGYLMYERWVLDSIGWKP